MEEHGRQGKQSNQKRKGPQKPTETTKKHGRAEI